MGIDVKLKHRVYNVLLPFIVNGAASDSVLMTSQTQIFK